MSSRLIQKHKMWFSSRSDGRKWADEKMHAIEVLNRNWVAKCVYGDTHTGGYYGVRRWSWRRLWWINTQEQRTHSYPGWWYTVSEYEPGEPGEAP